MTGRPPALCVEPGRYDAAARAVLADVVELHDEECADQPAFVAALGRAPYVAVFVRLGLAVDGEALQAAPGLAWVVTPTTGLDHIDLVACERAGVSVVSLRGDTEFLRGVRATAEHTWALLLALRRRLVAAHGDVMAGRWRRTPFVGEELAGATLGVIGHGRLGAMVAEMGVAFRMRVLVHDTDPVALESLPAGVEATGLDRLLTESDVVTLHLPHHAGTTGYLSAARLAAMKPGAVLVNTARGELVDEAALLAALWDGRLAGAALDVLDGDSTWDGMVPAGHPLVAHAAEHDNVVVTPHVGGFARQAIVAAGGRVAARFVEVVRTVGPLTHQEARS